jgi:hypothetical protein
MWAAGEAIDMVAVLVMLFRLLGHEGRPGPASSPAFAPAERLEELDPL